MEKEFVPYTLALRLKALGFNEPCFAFFNGKHLDFNVWDWEYPAGQKRRDIGECPLAPTFSQAFRWFRETHDLDGETARYNLSNSEAKLLGVNIKETKFVYLAVINGEDFPELEDITLFMSREEAELACLDKLLEIVESKSE